MEKKNELQLFTNELFGELRVVTVGCDYYFVAKDITNILGYSNPRDAIGRHCKKEGIITNKLIDAMNRSQQANFLNEDNLMLLIQKSKTKSTFYKQTFIKWLIKKELISDSKFILESRKEIEFFDMLENILEPFDYTCIRQFYVCENKYKIDLYIKEINLAIEYDENNHSNYTYEQQEGRQKEIEKELNCKFIRVDNNDSDFYNIGLIMKQILAIGNN